MINAEDITSFALNWYIDACSMELYKKIYEFIEWTSEEKHFFYEQNMMVELHALVIETSKIKPSPALQQQIQEESQQAN